MGASWRVGGPGTVVEAFYNRIPGSGQWPFCMAGLVSTASHKFRGVPCMRKARGVLFAHRGGGRGRLQPIDPRPKDMLSGLLAPASGRVAWLG